MSKVVGPKKNWKDRIKRENLESTTEPGFGLRGWTLDKQGVLVGVRTPHPKRRYKSDYSPRMGGPGDMHGIFSIADLDQFMGDQYSTNPVVGIISYGGTTRNNSQSGYIRSGLIVIKKLFLDAEEAKKDPALPYHLSKHYKVPVELFNDRDDLRDRLYNDLTVLEVVDPRVKYMTLGQQLEGLVSGELTEKAHEAQKEADTYQDALPYPEFHRGAHDVYKDTNRVHPRQIQHMTGLNEAFQNARKNRDEYHSIHFKDDYSHMRLHTFSSLFAHTGLEDHREHLKYEGWEEVSWKEFKTRLQNNYFTPSTWVLLERRPKNRPLWLEKAAASPSTKFSEKYLHHLGSEVAYRIDENGIPHRFSDFSNLVWELKDPKTGEYFDLEGSMDKLDTGVWDDTIRNKILTEQFQNEGLISSPEEARFLYRTRKEGDTPLYLQKFAASLQEGSEGPPKLSKKDVESINKDLLIRGFLGSKLQGQDLRLLGKSSEIMPASEMDKYKWDKKDNSLTYLPTGSTASFEEIRRGLKQEIQATTEPSG